MKQVNKTAEYTVFLRRDGRHAVRGANSKWINGEDKVAILQKEGLVKKPEPKPEPVAEEATDAAEGDAE